ncbi:transglycosylase family protein [Streptomyces litchfieldiae]|uniref:Transglycosylase family protein n=1 Tax=Streptomyces litchfieldiae TaxID=3075543 RepID=A0ABU2MYY5_9ACTN|nr:transglycosylase family protein [Streptomyces sp. DSM 44938]MDT0346865.1 transglycosylase family protein [Streptomyces sp. DSM 44938]
MSAGSAQAVGDETWDRAAECESGGVWSANTGNGYFGGLQLTLGMWEEYGGLEFAARPDLASRAQQISVAERILEDLGKEAFPACGVLSGLWQEFREERGDEVDRAEEAEEAQAEEEIGGAEESAAPEAGAGEEEAGPAGPAEKEPEGSAGEPDPLPWERPEEAPAETPEAGGGLPEGERAESSGSGRHRGEPDPAEAERAGEAGEGRHAERHEVRRGDTLSAIAVEYGVPGGWPALYAMNETVIGDDPDYILPGQELDLTVTGR